MVVTATHLRQNLYKLLDRALETGEIIEIKRCGKTLKILSEKSKCDFNNLIPHPDCIVGDPDDLVYIDWSKAWKPFI